MSDEDVAVEQDETLEGQEAELSDEQKAIAKLKEAISVEKEDIGSLRIKLTVTIPEETLDERRGEQFAELKRDAMVPGFRKGHAPIELVEKRFASDVGEQLKSQLLSSGYLAAVEKEGLKPLGDPLFWVKVQEERPGEDGVTRKVETEKLLPIDQALESFTVPKQGAVNFSCELELKPEFELPELKKIPVDQPVVSIDDEDVDGELRRLRMMSGTLQPVEDGAVQPDDLLYADMKMSVDGTIIVSESNMELAARDVHIQGLSLSGLGDALKGKKLNDQVTCEAAVPDDYDNIDIRGQTARFEFVIREIKRLIVPELDETFLRAQGFDSEDDLRSAIRESLEARLDATLREAMRSQVGKYLLDHTQLEIPEGLSQRQTERSVARRMIEMYQAGMPQAEIEKQLDQMRSSAADQVVRDLKLFFILERIAEDDDVEVPEEEINGAIADIAKRSGKRFDRVRDELSKREGLMMLYLKLRDQKVLDRLLKDAEVTETEGPKTKKKPAPKPKAKKKTSPKKVVKKPAKKKTGAQAE